MARSILVIIFHLLTDPEARFHDLGPGYYGHPLGFPSQLGRRIAWQSYPDGTISPTALSQSLSGNLL